MEFKEGITSADLIDLNFYQLIEYLSKEYCFDTNRIADTPMEDLLFRFSSNPQISFPSSDIEGIAQYYDSSHIEIMVNFLGAHGSSGPLPGCVLEDIAQESSNEEKTKEIYLNFFNHRLIVLLCAIWRKYKYHINYRTNSSDDFSQKVLALIGVDNKRLVSKQGTSINWSKLLFYVGLIQSKVRTASMISDVIQHYFDLDRVNIDEWERQRISLELEQQNQLGAANISLGTSLVLGSTVTSFSNKFNINIYGLAVDEFHQFLPTGDKYAELIEIMNFLLKDRLPYSISLSLLPSSTSNFILGNQHKSFLGWSTLLKAHSCAEDNIQKITITGQI